MPTLNLKISDKVQDKISRLKKKSGSKDDAQVIARALAVYESVINWHSENPNGEIILRNRSGEECPLRLHP